MNVPRVLHRGVQGERDSVHGAYTAAAVCTGNEKKLLKILGTRLTLLLLRRTYYIHTRLASMGDGRQ